MAYRSKLPVLGWFLVVGAMFTSLPADSGAQDKPTLRVGFVLDGKYPRAIPFLRLFGDELRSLLTSDFDIQFPDEYRLEADFTRAGVRDAVDQLMSNDQVGLVVALGVLSSHEVATRGPLPKPTIAPFVLDAVTQQLPSVDGASGVKNLNYLDAPNSFANSIDSYLEVVPFQTVAVLGDEEILRALPDVDVGGPRRPIVSHPNIMVDVIPIADDVLEAMNAIADDVDALYLILSPRLTTDQSSQLFTEAGARLLPTFAQSGETGVREGALFGLTPQSWWPRLARRAALNARHMLTGTDGGTLPTTITREQEYFINMNTARQIQVYPSFEIMTEAVLINDTRPASDQSYSVEIAMNVALEVNRDVVAGQQDVISASADVGVTRAGLLPQIDLFGSGTAIDADRARLGFGLQPEYSVVGEARVRLPLWQERAWANYGISKYLSRSAEAEQRALELNVALQAADAYYNVLLTKSIERIAKQNLSLSRSNLERAEVREKLGAASRSEVFRWESQIATDRSEVIQRNAIRNVSEIEFNRVLYRPLEEPFDLVDVELGPDAIPLPDVVLEYINNPLGLRVFRRFMVKRGLDNSPELHSLDQAIGARNRARLSAQHRFYSPDLILDAGISTFLYRDGAGSDFPLGTGLDNVRWDVNLLLTYPLLTSGDRTSALRQAKADLLSLEYQRQSAAQQVEQRVRSSVHVAGASLAGINLSIASASAARSNYELVEDSYTSGAATLITLLDAQRTAVNAEANVANSVYGFLLDLMEVERSVGEFTVFAPQDEKDAWVAELQEFYRQEGAQP